MSYLGFREEWIHKDKIQHVVSNDTVIVYFGRHVAEMRTTFDSKIFGVKTYVLELVELDEADELLILFKLYNILGLLIGLKSVHQHQLRVA